MAGALRWLRLPEPLLGTSVIGGFGPYGLPYMNFAKQGNYVANGDNYPLNLSDDGYPISTPSTTIQGSYPLPDTYFGRYRLSFSGQGSFTMQGPPAIIYSGGAAVSGVSPSSSGSVTSNMGIFGQSNPDVEFAFGAMIWTVTDNGSGLVRLTALLTNAFNNITDGSTIQINNVANLTGTWVTTGGTANTVDLVGSTYSAGMVPASTGTPGTQAEAILSQNAVTFNFPAFGTYSSMSNLIHCRKADIDGTNAFGLQAGYQVNADVVAQIAALKPKYIRLMDAGAVIGSTESSYTYRPLVSHFSNASGAAKWYSAYQVGDITNNGSDTYTCSNPSASSGGAYVDGEVVQGRFVGANTGVNPLINVNSRGAAKIFQKNGRLQNLFLSGSCTTGDVISIVFTGSYIPTGSYTFQYTVQSGDTSLGTLGANLKTAINADATLAGLDGGKAAITATNAGGGFCTILYNVNAGSGTTFSASVSGAATEVVTLGRWSAGEIANNTVRSLTYSALLGGFIDNSADVGLNGGMPQETMCELCNRANVGLYDSIPMLYTGAAVSAKVANIASLLNSNLPLALEVSNEVWNFGQPQTTQAQSLGLALGFDVNSLRAIYGFYALRVRQFMALAETAWVGAGRTRSKLNCSLQFQAAGDTTNTDTYRLKGTDLTTSNSYYSAKGGLGATAGTSYTAVGQRPIDVCDSVGWAAYWYGKCFNQGAGYWTGSINNFDAALQAGEDYASGNGTLMANALTAMYNDIYDGSLDTGDTSEVQTMVTHLAYAAAWYTVIAAFDAARAGFGKSPINVTMYESGQQVSFSATPQGYAFNGAALASQFTSNGWNTAPYGASNAVVAQQCYDLWEAFKRSDKMYDMLLALYNGVIAACPGREVNPASYQYDGPATWALFPGDIYTTPYKSYDAIVAFNSVAH